MRARFAPIDFQRHADVCVRFRRDSFVCSFGSDAEFERTGGAEGYLEWLRARAAELPEGIVHVWSGDEIVGQIEMRIRGVPPEGYVNLFYLVPSARGSGLATSLQDYVVALLRARTIASATLSVSPGNHRAIRYYAKHGWIDLGPRSNTPEVHVMKLVLDEPMSNLPPIPTRLETERLLLRWFTLDDIDAYNELGTDPQIIRYVGNQPFASLAAARETLVAAPLKDYATYGYGRFACVWKQTGEVVGLCGPKFLPDTGDVDLGYRFLPKFWGMGLATEAGLAAVDYARQQLGLRRLVAWVHPDNVASARVLTKLGFAFDRSTTVADIPDIEFDFYAKRFDS